MARREQTPVAEQLRRSAELDALRGRRRLTRAEHDEADRLAHRAYMRVWRARQAEIERGLARGRA